VDEADVALRNTTYAMFVELGRAPTATDVADRTGRSPAEVVGGWRRLHDGHALVLNGRQNEIRMANPFSAVPTAYRVEAAGRRWYANCAWDAFGICAALDTEGRIECSCPDCGEPLVVEVTTTGDPEPADLHFHCLVPAREWWDDIVFT
jgi:hypothetical protein